MDSPSPYIFGNFDAAEFCLIAFFVFFAGLVFYLRREDRREGYPLEDDVTGRLEPLGGLFFTAQPKTFILPHGHGTRTYPNLENRDRRPVAARRSAPMDGAPIEPTGNPFLDGVGPGAYAERPDYPDLALDGRPFDIACGQIDIGNAFTEMAAPMAKGVPQANGEIAPEAVMDVGHVADAVLHMASLPLEANVLFMNVMATKMPFVGRG